MSENAVAKGYAESGFDAVEHGRRRLEHFEVMCDEHTFATLGALPIAADWRCLEIGAGAGSVARWLAERVPDGEVVATDLNTAYLPQDIANLRLVEQDVRMGDFAAATFDLVHSRAVLQHLEDPGEVLLKAAEWLKPGGWIVEEGLDATVGLRSALPELVRTTTLVLETVQRAVGTDSEFHRGLPRFLLRAGFEDVGASYVGHPVGPGAPYQAMLEASMEQLRSAVVAVGTGTADDVDEMQAWVAANDVTDLGMMSTSVWARKPVS